MSKKLRQILVIDGHPDPYPGRYVHALAESYCAAAIEAGHDVRSIRLADMDIPVLRSRDEWSDGAVSKDIKSGQDAISWADHLVFLYPLWLGDVPAHLKAYLEQVMRPGFALAYESPSGPSPLLKGKTAHIIVTMGMPALFYNAFYGAHSLRSFKRNILAICGIDTINSSVIGNVEGSAKHREKWLKRIAGHGYFGD
ncbi:MAG: NAD(P)H-dependent oxidoreductase [Parasphingorhabdus sp.]|nr:NAD(P)H-dependent oxidoreductase [Parasphingorhabdus sp.]